MNGRLREVPEGTLCALAAALRAGKLKPPFSRATVEHVVGGPSWLAEELDALALPPAAMAWGIELLAQERAEWRSRWGRVELTWTGPEDVVTQTRDTGAVARQLFAEAKRTLLVSTYALDEGARGENLLGVLRQRMAERDLDVRFYVNLPRDYEDARPSEQILAEHVRRLREKVFTWEPRPAVFYDRRALEPGHGPRACLHAKVIVRDETQTLITSANLTEAALERNVEAGVLIDDAVFARGVVGQFERLVAAGVLVPMVWRSEK
jgi:phosphatidylserine/phosphatidylglycerophosphate/cardiolipin synthase-like enzyme